MGFTYTLLSVFFEEFKIPADPLTFIFEIVLLVFLGIPRTIGAIISYVYFPEEPKSVEGNVILITGTGRGNGRELALQFHRLGAKIACVDKDEVGNNETVERITEEGGRAVGFTVDITDKEQVTKMHAAVRAQMGPVDILINNAAVIETTLFVNPEADQIIKDIVDTNLLGQIWVIREILPSMLERNSGHIVTISSLMAFKGLTFHFTYAATKYALNGMMESLTRELKLMKSDVITTTASPYFIANCTDRSRRRILRIPELPTEETCEVIVEGILRNERVFTVPNYHYFALPFVKFLPEDLQNMVDDIFYSAFVPTAKEDELLRKYTKIAEMNKPQTSFFAPCLKMGSVLDEDEQ
ncbi:Short-chain dehydrogenase/reductase SDR,NAD(P)-binding domain [Cinara cedri]|uniref:Short-chain dehydrogenase/reductase SDR,NAD(P)-binding domain n=1 Tax=Cinara cedri TaxID=506608 RepID=A0A5E4NDY6_9HEMI|nr:Short-chain dehydrogenase/reductase SDR,NAD(P)-binding domain [Cinara cedri]